MLPSIAINCTKPPAWTAPTTRSSAALNSALPRLLNTRAPSLIRIEPSIASTKIVPLELATLVTCCITLPVARISTLPDCAMTFASIEISPPDTSSIRPKPVTRTPLFGSPDRPTIRDPSVAILTDPPSLATNPERAEAISAVVVPSAWTRSTLTETVPIRSAPSAPTSIPPEPERPATSFTRTLNP